MSRAAINPDRALVDEYLQDKKILSSENDELKWIDIEDSINKVLSKNENLLNSFTTFTNNISYLQIITIFIIFIFGISENGITLLILVFSLNHKS
mgnify:CR=1 FL=1